MQTLWASPLRGFFIASKKLVDINEAFRYIGAVIKKKHKEDVMEKRAIKTMTRWFGDSLDTKLHISDHAFGAIQGIRSVFLMNEEVYDVAMMLIDFDLRQINLEGGKL